MSRDIQDIKRSKLTHQTAENVFFREKMLLRNRNVEGSIVTY